MTACCLFSFVRGFSQIFRKKCLVHDVVHEANNPAWVCVVLHTCGERRLTPLLLALTLALMHVQQHVCTAEQQSVCACVFFFYRSTSTTTMSSYIRVSVLVLHVTLTRIWGMVCLLHSSVRIYPRVGFFFLLRLLAAQQYEDSSSINGFVQQTAGPPCVQYGTDSKQW